MNVLVQIVWAVETKQERACEHVPVMSNGPNYCRLTYNTSDIVCPLFPLDCVTLLEGLYNTPDSGKENTYKRFSEG